jgi:hypothetical protein
MEVQIQVSNKQIIDFENRFKTCSLEEIIECPCCFRQVIGDDSARSSMMSNLSLQEKYAVLFKDHLVQLYEQDKTQCPVCEKQIDVGNIEQKCEIEVSLGIMVLKKIHSDLSTKKSNHQFKHPIILDNYIVEEEWIMTAVNFIKKMSQLSKKTRSLKLTHNSKTTFRISLEIFGNALSEAVEADLAAKPTELQLSIINAIGRFAKVFLCILEKTSQLIDTVGLLAITDNKKLSTKLTKYSIMIEHYIDLAKPNPNFLKGAHFKSILLDCIETIINIEKSAESEEKYIDLLKSFGSACIFISENISKIVGICTDGVLKILLTNSNCAVGGKNLKCVETFQKIVESVKKLVEKSSKEKPLVKHQFKHSVDELIREYTSKIEEYKEKQTKIYNEIANTLHNNPPVESSKISEFDKLSQEIDFMEIALIILEQPNKKLPSNSSGSEFDFFRQSLMEEPSIDFGSKIGEESSDLYQLNSEIKDTIREVENYITEIKKMLKNISNENILDLNEYKENRLPFINNRLNELNDKLSREYDEYDEYDEELSNLSNILIPGILREIYRFTRKISKKVKRFKDAEAAAQSTVKTPAPLSTQEPTAAATPPLAPAPPLTQVPTLAPPPPPPPPPPAPAPAPAPPLTQVPTLAPPPPPPPALSQTPPSQTPLSTGKAPANEEEEEEEEEEEDVAEETRPPPAPVEGEEEEEKEEEVAGEGQPPAIGQVVVAEETGPPPSTQSMSGEFSTPQEVEEGKLSPDTYELKKRKCYKNNNQKNKPDLILDYDKNIEIIKVNQNTIFSMLKRKNLIDNNISTDEFFNEYIENKNNFTVSALCSILEYISSPEALQEDIQSTTGSLQEGTQDTTGSPASRTRQRLGKK